MKYLIFLYSWIVMVPCWSQGMLVRNLQKEEAAVLTFDEHINWGTWGMHNERIAFTSSMTGVSNVYYLDLTKITLKKQYKGLYYAEYLDKGIDKRNFYIPITRGVDTSFSQPEYSPHGRQMLVKGEYCPEPIKDSKESCVVTRVFLIDAFKLTMEPTEITDVTYFCWLDDLSFMYEKASEPGQLYKYHLSSKVITKLYKLPEKVQGLANSSDKVYAVQRSHVYEFDLAGGLLKDYEIVVEGEKVTEVEFLNLMFSWPGIASVIYDLNDSKITPILEGSEDFNPTLSFDKKMAAMISFTINGIVVKRLK